jgi:glycosyltransferase involved in cell wall biosynthesis
VTSGELRVASSQVRVTSGEVQVASGPGSPVQHLRVGCNTFDQEGLVEFVIGHVIVGPPEHGVVRFAEQLARELGGPVLRLGPVTDRAEDPADQADLTDLAELTDLTELAGADVVLMQYTESLYGSDPEAAATGFAALRGRIRQPVTVSLHDLPDPADEPVRYRRRAAGYRSVRTAVEAVVVSSQHEARLLARFLTMFSAGHSAVVPLPLDIMTPPSHPRPEPRTELAVLGFIHPGKGYDDALAALRAVGPEIAFTAIGRAAPGHDDLIDVLRDDAARVGRSFQVTGFVPDAELLHRLREVAVPVAPSRAVSASGTIGTWISAGRRPLVAAGAYTRELADRCPGAVHLYEPDDLPDLIRASLADPSLTWLDADCQVGPGVAGTAAAYRELLQHVATQPLAGMPVA